MKRIKDFYSHIMLQAIEDLEHPKKVNGQPVDYTEDVYRFLNSDWGKQILGVLDIAYSDLEKRFNLTERVERIRELRRLEARARVV